MAEGQEADWIIELVVLEQFVLLAEAIQLAEDHLVTVPGPGHSLFSCSLPPSLSYYSPGSTSLVLRCMGYKTGPANVVSSLLFSPQHSFT